MADVKDRRGDVSVKITEMKNATPRKEWRSFYLYAALTGFILFLLFWFSPQSVVVNRCTQLRSLAHLRGLLLLLSCKTQVLRCRLRYLLP
jgi:hypothetical protein